MNRSRGLAVTAWLLGAACQGHTLAPPPLGDVAPIQVAQAMAPVALGQRGFIDHDAHLAGYADAEWYEENIPFFECSDKDIEEVYYYRFSVLRRNLRYTSPDSGYVFTEFVHAPWYAAAYGAINAAAGHHLHEARWLKTQRYLDDYTLFWLRGPGQPGARQYSFWVADSVYARYLVNGDAAFVKDLLPDLVRQYEAWDDHFDGKTGLYRQEPVWDAMEYTIGSYQTKDPFQGGTGLRPPLNAYQYGDAMAIARVATLAGQGDTAARFRQRALDLKRAVQSQLWDPSRHFYFHRMVDNAVQGYPHPEGTLLDGREEVGFVPWYFDMPDAENASAWQALLDRDAFAAPFGPTTAERRHPLFMHDAAHCCRWDGPSWPFSTSQTLTAMANLLGHVAQPYVTAGDYFALLQRYAKAQHKDGRPYVAEALDADSGQWIYDTPNHSEHYNHSTYADLVITGLVGIRPREDDRLEVSPLSPLTMDYFALEDVLVHGHRVTVLWDRLGDRYHLGAGLFVLQDGAVLVHAKGLERQVVTMAPVAPPPATPRRDNLLANLSGGGFPKVSASYTWRGDDPWQAVDGTILFDDIPNSRWTNYQSLNEEDWLSFEFDKPRTISELTLYLYDDGGGVRAPAAYDVEVWKDGAWVRVAHPVKWPERPEGRRRNVVTFAPETVTKLRVVFENAKGAYSGVTEVEAWVPGGGAAASSADPGMRGRE